MLYQEGRLIRKRWRAPRVCLVAIAIGSEFSRAYSECIKKSHVDYCRRVGYEYRLLEGFIDPTASNVSLSSLQKILVCDALKDEDFDVIVYVDCDVVISRIAPAIHLHLDQSGRIGIVDEYSQPTREKRLAIQVKQNWERSASEYYALAGCIISTDIVVNTGVMVFQPALHHRQLASIYWSGRDIAVTHSRGFHFEQALVGFHLQVTNNVQLLSSKWNAIWPLQKISDDNKLSLTEFASKNYFIHLAGKTDTSRAWEILNL